ncbi:hypothetical protein RCL1_000955 [Eukaryota sp. TZLM3-RCL]
MTDLAFTTSHPPSESRSLSASSTRSSSISPKSEPTFITHKELDTVLQQTVVPAFSELPESDSVTHNSARNTLHSLLSLLSDDPTESNYIDGKIDTLLALNNSSVQAAVFPDSNVDPNTLLSFVMSLSKEEQSKIGSLSQKFQEISRLDDEIESLTCINNPTFIYDDSFPDVDNLFEERPAARAIFQKLTELNQKFKLLGEGSRRFERSLSARSRHQDSKVEERDHLIEDDDMIIDEVPEYTDYTEQVLSKISDLENRIDSISTDIGDDVYKGQLFDRLNQIDSELGQNSNQSQTDSSEFDYLRSVREAKEARTRLKQLNDDLNNLRILNSSSNVDLSNLIAELTGKPAHKAVENTQSPSFSDLALSVMREYQVELEEED